MFSFLICLIGILANPWILIILVITFIVLIFANILGEKEENKPLAKEDFKPVEENLKHIYGLPLAEGTVCTVSLNENGFKFLGAGTVFNLDINKITDVAVNTDTNTQTTTQYVSNPGGAVAGGLLFGAAGAAIGGRAKKKTDTVTTYDFALVITYVNENAVNYISFELPSGLTGDNYVNNYRCLKSDEPPTKINAVDL